MIGLRRLLVAVSLPALIVVAGWFSASRPMKEAAGVNAAPETLAALRSNARFCMEHPFEQFLIQGLVVQSFQRIHDPLLEAQEVRHATGGAFSSAGAPLNRVAAGQGIVKAYTLFRIPLASLVVTMDASGLVSCRRL